MGVRKPIFGLDAGGERVNPPGLTIRKGGEATADLNRSVEADDSLLRAPLEKGERGGTFATGEEFAEGGCFPSFATAASTGEGEESCIGPLP